MKKIIQTLKIYTIFLFPLGLFYFSNYRNSHRVFDEKKITIQYHPKNYKLLYDTEVLKTIFKEQIPKNQGALSIGKIEKLLNEHPMIEQSQVFLHFDGTLNIEIKQKEPIARIIRNNNNFCYMDKFGKKMPLSEIYQAQVITIELNNDNLWEDFYKIAHYIDSNTFLKGIVTDIDFENKNFLIRIREADFKVIIGDSNELKNKFYKFIAFLQHMEREKKNLNTYKIINLKMGNQVIATK